MIKNLSIRNKIILIILAVTSFSIFAGFTMIIVYETKSAKDELVSATMMHARLISEYAIRPLMFDFADEGADVLTKLQTIPDIEKGCIFDNDGKVFASYNEDAHALPAWYNGKEADFLFEGDHLTVCVPVLFQDEKHGTLHLTAATVAISAKLYNISMWMFIIVLIVILMAYFVALRLQKIISEPILDLAHITQSISKNTDYTLRVEKQGQDEIGELCDSFNEMLVQIERRQEERDKAESELSKSEMRLKKLFDSTPDLIWLKDKNGVFLSCNAKFERLFGAKEKDIIGKTDYDFISKELADSFRAFDKKAILANKICINEEEVVFADNGHREILETIKSPFYDAEGELVGVFGIARDITTRKRAEVLQQVLYNISNAGSISHDMDSFYKIVHEEVGKLIDAKNFFIGLYDPAQEVIHLPFNSDQNDGFSEIPGMKTCSAYVIKNKKPVFLRSDDVNKLVADGVIELVGKPSKLWLGVPLKIEDGVIGLIVVQSYEDENAYDKQDLAFLEFVSDQIAVSINRKNAEDALRESEERFRDMADLLPQPVSETDLKGNIIYVNQIGLDMFGYTKKEVDQGLNISDIIDPVDHNLMRQNFKLAINADLGPHNEYTMLKKNGETFPAIIYSSLIRDKGKPVGLRTVIANIEERKEFEELLQIQRDISTFFSSTDNMNKSLEYLLNKCLKIEPFDSGGIYIVDDDGGIKLAAHHGLSQKFVKSAANFEADSPQARLIKAGASVYHIYSDLFQEDKDDMRANEGLLSIGIIPVKYNEQVVACLNLASRTQETIPQKTQNSIAAIVTHIGEFIDRLGIQEKLRQSEERFRNIHESGAVGIAMTGEDNIFLTVNPRFCQMMEYSEDELFSKTFFDLTYPDDVNISKGFMKNFRNEKPPFAKIEKRYVTKSGKILWGLTTVSAINRGKGKQPFTLGIIQDITARKQIEEALRENEEKYASLFQYSNDLIFLHDLDGNILDVNQKCMDVFEYDKSEIISLKVFQLHPPDVLEIAGESFKKIMRDGYVEFEIDFVTKSGSRFTAEVSSSLFEISGKKVIQGIARDITERKKAEDTLRESEEKFRSYVENAHDGILIAGDDSKFEYANAELSRLLGYPLNEIIGREFISFLDESSRKLMSDHYQRRRKGEEVPHKYEIMITRKNGEKRNIEISSAIIKDSSGKMKTIAHLLDITERRQLQEQLNQSQKMEAIGKLAGGVAHDFNNLLTIISGYSNLLLLKEDVSEQGKHKLEEIQKASSRAEALTRQLLAFSRKQIVQPRIVELNSIINESNKMLARLIGENIKIKLILEPGLPSIQADPHQIEQILVNLVVNAKDAIQERNKSSRKKLITIETKYTCLDDHYVKKHPECNIGRHVEFSVSDTGMGMDKQTIDKIFDPFYTTKKIGQGTGLGLSTVYGIIKQNKASINVYSEPDKGAIFRVYWPVTDDEADHPGRIVKPEIQKGNEKILLVEDDEAVREFGEESLLSLGYTVYSARNGRQAINLVKNKKINPDMLLTDIIMPGMDGEELSHKVQKLLPNILVLFTSGYTDDHIGRKGFLDKGVYFLEKPYSITSLSVKIREVLDK